jgi:peptidoglycan hydrolase CwlO-like protein
MINENESKPEVTNPLLDNKSIDLSGIMNIAGSLLKNPEVLNTVSDVMKLTNNGHETTNKPEERQENTLSALQKQVTEMNQQIIDLQNEIIKNNEELKELILKMQSSLEKRKWWF